MTKKIVTKTSAPYRKTKEQVKENLSEPVDISIEYAHIYSNEKINEEQKISLEVLQEVKDSLNKNNQTFVLLVLVDDYSFPDPTFDYGPYSDWLDGYGLRPDLIIRESQLIPLCDQILASLTNEKMKEQLINYIKLQKYPCSLFIAAWYLLRLGHLTNVIYDKKYISKSILNILPESFKPYEEKAIDIIKATPFAGAEKYIEYKYLKGRDIRGRGETGVMVPIKQQLSTVIENFIVEPVEEIKNIASRNRIVDNTIKRSNATALYKILDGELLKLTNKIKDYKQTLNREQKDHLLSLLEVIDENDEESLKEFGIFLENAWLQDIIFTIVHGDRPLVVNTITASPTPYIEKGNKNIITHSWGMQLDDVNNTGIEIAKLFKKLNPITHSVKLLIHINEFFDAVPLEQLADEKRNNYVIAVMNYLGFKGVIGSEDIAGLDYIIARESSSESKVGQLIKKLRGTHHGTIVIEEDSSVYFKPTKEFIEILGLTSQLRIKDLLNNGIALRHADGSPSPLALQAAQYMNPINKHFMFLSITDTKERERQDKLYALLRALTIVKSDRYHNIFITFQNLSTEVIMYCFVKLLLKYTKQFLKTLDYYSEWSSFDPYEYVSPNFENHGEILPEDQEIIGHMTKALSQIGIEQKSLQTVADVGTGPNLYPAMILSPYMAKDSALHMIEFSAPNRDYMQKVITGTIDDFHASIWHKFEKYMINVGGEIYLGAERKAKEHAKIIEGDIFNLPKNTYELITSYFVAESIVDSKMLFHEALQSLSASLKKDGLLINTHMVYSEGYSAGESTRFPAVKLSLKQIKQAYLDTDMKIIKIILFGENTKIKVREGYHGMALVIAHP